MTKQITAVAIIVLASALFLWGVWSYTKDVSCTTLALWMWYRVFRG